MSLRILAVVIALATAGCSTQIQQEPEIVPVRIGLVAVDSNDLPVVILREQEGPRWLPIWIGTSEATSIAREMEREVSPRPNTHDLTKRVIEGLRSELLRVIVSELKQGTYYAVMELRVRGNLVQIDARPSDAIAIALRLDAPIFVNATLFENAADSYEGDIEGQQI